MTESIEGTTKLDTPTNPLLEHYVTSSSLALEYNLTEGYIKRLCRKRELDYLSYPNGDGGSDYLVEPNEWKDALVAHKRENRQKRTRKAKNAAADRKKAVKAGFTSVADWRDSLKKS